MVESLPYRVGKAGISCSQCLSLHGWAELELVTRTRKQLRVCTDKAEPWDSGTTEPSASIGVWAENVAQKA